MTKKSTNQKETPANGVSFFNYSSVAETRLKLFKEMEDQISVLKNTERRLKATWSDAFFTALPFKPILALPRLLPDHSNIDLLDRSHVKAQTEQIVGIMSIITTPRNPLIHSTKIKKYILSHFEIPHPDYWLAKSGPKETERWWKHIYDKAIERIDVQEGLILRKNKTGKKGMYALKEYYVKTHAQQELDFQPLKVRLPFQKTPLLFVG